MGQVALRHFIVCPKWFAGMKCHVENHATCIIVYTWHHCPLLPNGNAELHKWQILRSGIARSHHSLNWLDFCRGPNLLQVVTKQCKRSSPWLVGHVCHSAACLCSTESHLLPTVLTCAGHQWAAVNFHCLACHITYDPMSLRY